MIETLKKPVTKSAVDKFLAKSNGVTLIAHSNLVARISCEIANQCLTTDREIIIEAIHYAALLHDIGKIPNSFQKKLRKTNTDDDNMEKSLPYRHNEVGWAFLNIHLKFKNSDFTDYVLYAAYWHHGISNKMNDYYDSDIYNKISDVDKANMLKYLKAVIGEENVCEKEYNPQKAPLYYHDNDRHKNAIKTFILICVISGDRLASDCANQNIADTEIKELILNLNIKPKNIDIEQHIYSGNERFNIQKQIPEKTGRTTIIKAPPGFGKTLVGLQWWFKRNKKLIWVCPRNIIAQSAYKLILQELKYFGIKDVSVELFLAGETVAHNENFKESFTSDIIVTNIDNYLSPSANVSISFRLFAILASDVVFDEFHENSSIAPFFFCFVNIMKVRHQLTNSTTLLLSATPSNMYRLWDSQSMKTVILPDENSHYPGQHNQKFLFRTLDEFDIKTENNLIIFNSISNAQKHKNKFNAKLLIHSGFVDKDKEEKINELYKLHGKDSVHDNSNVIGTHVIQASLDISFKNEYESVCSPEDSGQRSGRCNRGGEFGDRETSISMVNYSNNSEIKVRNILYTNDLSMKWFEFNKQYDGKYLSIDEISEKYNRYYRENDELLYRYFKNKETESLSNASKNIYPKKYYSSKKKSDIKTAGSNKLRTIHSEVFYICKIYKTNTYTDPITTQVYGNDFKKTFKEEGNIHNRLLKTMKEIRNSNDDRFDFNEILNNKSITIDDIRVHARRENTPYIRFDKVYHEDYGVISESSLIELLEEEKHKNK